MVGEPWLWFSRAVMPDDRLAEILGDPEVEAYALNDGRADVGLLELDFRPEGEVELAFLGLVPGFIGQGAGRFLMNEAIAPRLRPADPALLRPYLHARRTRAPSPSISARASRPTSARSRWRTIPACSASCRGTSAPHVPVLAPRT